MTFDDLVCIALYSSGIDTDRGNVNLQCFANHVPLSLASWQYAYSGHVINLPQDVASFVNTLPRLPNELDVIVVRKEGDTESHHDFRVRRSVVLRAL